MATVLRDPVSCRYLCFAEREEIAVLRAGGAPQLRGPRRRRRRAQQPPAQDARLANPRRGPRRAPRRSRLTRPHKTRRTLPTRPRARLSPLRPALRAILRDDSHAAATTIRELPTHPLPPHTNNPVLRRPVESGLRALVCVADQPGLRTAVGERHLNRVDDAGQEQPLGPGEEVVGDADELEPDAVVLEVAERQVAHAGVSIVANVVLDPCADAVIALDDSRPCRAGR